MKDGAVLVIEHQGSERFVQFAKYSQASGEAILSFGFPDATWSRRYFDAVKGALSENGVQCSISETGDVLTPRFLEVECRGEDVDSAAKLAALAFAAMGVVEEEARFCGYLKGELDSREVVGNSVGAVEARLTVDAERRDNERLS